MNEANEKVTWKKRKPTRKQRARKDKQSRKVKIQVNRINEKRRKGKGVSKKAKLLYEKNRRDLKWATRKSEELKSKAQNKKQNRLEANGDQLKEQESQNRNCRDEPCQRESLFF